MVSQNRHNILTNLKAKFDIDSDEKDKRFYELNQDSVNFNIHSNINEISEMESDHDSNRESENDKESECDNYEPKYVQKTTSKTVFDLDIPYDTYCKMKPVSVIYGKNNREYKVLKQGAWTNIIFDEFQKKFKLPCCFVFKRCKVFSSSADNFLKLFAKCKEKSCGADFYAFAKHQPIEGESLQLKVFTLDTRNIPHNSSFMRQLNGNKREEIGRELQNQYCYLWQREEANKKMEFGDKVPPNIYKTEVLRNAKQTFRDSKLGINIKHPIISLVELKHTIPFAGSIHLVSADPFIVHYWTPTQMVVYKDACHSHNKNSRLCIDATGSVVKKIFRTSQSLKSAHIFLYVAVLHNGTLQLPVSQMLSESQDTPTITFWLSQWLRSGAPFPTEIVCDYSNALIGAITRSFCGGISRKQYCERSLNILMNKDVTLPEVYVRLDIAHFTKMVCRWKCLRIGPIKEFFVRAIILLMQCKTLEEFKDLFVKIIVIACSETDGLQKGSKIDSPAENFRNELVSIIEDRANLYEHIIINENDETDQLDGLDNFEDKYQPQKDDLTKEMDIFLQQLHNKINTYCKLQGTRINAFYVPKLKDQLNRIVKDFPLWSNVMSQYYNTYFITATSAPVESYFSDLKRELNKTLTPDRFVASHIKSIEGFMKICRSNQIQNMNTIKPPSIGSPKQKVEKNDDCKQIQTF